MNVISTDFLIIGGGVIGVNLAMQAKQEFPDSQVMLIEKENSMGEHASGRNSGVLHAGFYYTSDSLKARFTKEGNALLTQYCDENKLPINKCGKLVVAQNEEELPVLDELMARAKNNNVQLHKITEKEAWDIEPRVKTCQHALYSPTTSTVDPERVLSSFSGDAKRLGIDIKTGVKYLKKTTDGILTNIGNINAKYIINAAGLYADKIAMDFGFSKHYRILPFKGIYLYSNEAPEAYKTNIYPVPNLKNPFLGVHFTKTVEGKTKIGPTAIPALWRENYHGFDNFNITELLSILFRELKLFSVNHFDFRKLAFEEILKYYKPHLVDLASGLASGVHTGHYTKWGKPGIRAQLIDIKSNRLEMDFVYEGDDKSFHVLNAVSPAFTCSMSFTKFLFCEIKKLLQ